MTQQISQLQLLADLLDAIPAVRTLSHRWAGATASNGSAARGMTTTALEAPTLGFQPSPPWHGFQSFLTVPGVRLVASDASSTGVAAQAAPATAAATAGRDIPDDSIPSDGGDDSRPGEWLVASVRHHVKSNSDEVCAAVTTLLAVTYMK